MKNVTKKEKVDKVELVSYSIKMTIPTAAYANIQPEIIVKASTIEQAHDYIAPHMNRLWKEYYMISERPINTDPQQATEPVVVPPAPVEAVAFNKALNALSNCKSTEALDLIINQIKKSVKLSDSEKDKLLAISADKIKELNAETK